MTLSAAVLCLAAAPAKPGPVAAAVKAAPAKPLPARPAPTRAAVPATDFDARNPQGLMELVGAAGAKVQTRSREDDTVFVAVTSTAASFSMQFAGCSPQGRGCRAVLFDAALDRAAVGASQINGFNQTSVMCRVYQDRAGMQHVLYSTILLKSSSRDDLATHLQAWQGCLADAHDFLKDPVAYLANSA